MLKTFLRQLPDPLLSRQLASDYPFSGRKASQLALPELQVLTLGIGEFDVLTIAATIRKLAKSAQETIKDIFIVSA